MTTSTTENREPAQATATAVGKPKPPHKARAAAKKGHAAASKARSAGKPRSAKKGAQPCRKAGNARPGSKTAKILDLVKRPGGATCRNCLRRPPGNRTPFAASSQFWARRREWPSSLPSRRMGNALIRSKSDLASLQTVQTELHIKAGAAVPLPEARVLASGRWVRRRSRRTFLFD